MKKIILLLIIIITVSNLHAQKTVGGGFRRGGTNHQVKGMYKKQLMDTLGISKDQADKVDAIQQNYKLKMRAVNMDTQISRAEKRIKTEALQAERRGELSVVLTEEQIAKLDGIKKEVKKTKHHKHKRKHSSKKV